MRLQSQSLFSFVVIGLFGLGAPPVLAQMLASAVPEAGTAGLESFGLGGIAVALAIWAVRESYQRRLDEQKQLNELRMEEARQYAASIERIYRSKQDVDARMYDQHERIIATQNEFIRLALAREARAAEEPQKGAAA